MKINTTPGETYIVLSTGGCTVTTGAGKQIKKLAAGQDFFTAMSGESVISDDNASVTVAKGEILSLLSAVGSGSAAQATLQFQPVTNQAALPTTGDGGTIYLVPNGKTGTNKYTEWVWTGSAYEQLGDVGVDLSGYAKKSELASDVTTAFSYRTFETYSLTVNSGGAYISGLTIQNPQGGPGSKLTADDNIMQNSETFDNQFLHINSDVMIAKGLNVGAKVLSAKMQTLTAECSDMTVLSTARFDGEAILNDVLRVEQDARFAGYGWDNIRNDILADATTRSAPYINSKVAELVAPPSSTVDTWQQERNILMHTSGGQLNLSSLTGTLETVTQNNPLQLAKRTLWVSTSPGTGDAIQWPANTIFPADQAQDTVQQLNSNSTYWFDITYVGGIGKLLVRTICVWPTLMDTNEPTD